MKRILHVDGQAVVRDGLRKILDAQPGAVVFGEASDSAEALQLVREQEWDLVVLGLALRGRSGLDVLKELNQIRPDLPVLILTMHSEVRYARRAFKAGAAGYITKDSPRAELVNAINAVVEGGRYVSAAFAEIVGAGVEKTPDRPIHEVLSDREFEVLCSIGRGNTVSEIAKVLSLSHKTISTYRARVLKKMAMKNNAELMHYVIQNKLTD